MVESFGEANGTKVLADFPKGFPAGYRTLPREKAVYDVVGPICETSDFLGKKRELAIAAGDYLVQRSAGAYGASMSSNYNSRPRTAEVTLGGVDTREVSSKTMESLKSPGLYFVGEVLDVSGHLGGFNFQWAWASGYAAAQYV